MLFSHSHLILLYLHKVLKESLQLLFVRWHEPREPTGICGSILL